MKLFLNHKQVHKTIKCESCGESFNYKAYYSHRKVCQVYKCDLCDFETKSKKDWPSTRKCISQTSNVACFVHIPPKTVQI